MRRKILCVLLILCAILSVVPISAFAKDSQEPSVSAYATKEQLKTAFMTDSATGYAQNVGKIIFGKNISGEPMSWFVLGPDSGVDGDNLVIYAADHITPIVAFSDTTVVNWNLQQPEYQYEANTGYGSSAGSKYVYATHYGASLARRTLIATASNSELFSASEQALMNTTTVSTYDPCYDLTYTTSDKLYLLNADGDSYNNKYIVYAGSQEQIALHIQAYCYVEGSTYDDWGQTWLRAARTDKWSSEHVLNTNGGVINSIYAIYSTYDTEARPAANINITNVSFASSAQCATSSTAVCGTISSGSAMTLRFDGSDKNLGIAEYDIENGLIKIKSLNASENIALTVQGNDGANDWYYSKYVSLGDTVTTADIKAELGISTDIDLSDCRIWLETEGSDGFLYAVNATIGSYAVTYNANAGIGTMDDAEFWIGISSKLATNVFEKHDYKFAGWNTKADGSGTSYADEEVVLNLTAEKNTVVTLYAQWKDAIPPAFSGIESNKEYCEKIEFTVSDNDDEIESVKDGDTVILPDSNGKYVIEDEGEKNITVTDKSGNLTTITVVLNKEHIAKEDDGDCTTSVGCEQCDEDAIPGKSKHAWGEWELTDEGTHIRYCTNEGCTISDTNYTQPKTGDNSNVITLIALFVVSGGLLSIMFCKAKNNSVKQK